MNSKKENIPAKKNSLQESETIHPLVIE